MTCDTWYMISDMRHMTHDMWHKIYDKQEGFNDLEVRMFWRYFHKGSLTELINKKLFVQNTGLYLSVKHYEKGLIF